MTRLLRAPLSDGSRFDEVSGGAVLALRATAAAAASDGIEREEDNEGISHRRLNELRGKQHGLWMDGNVGMQGEIVKRLLISRRFCTVLTIILLLYLIPLLEGTSIAIVGPENELPIYKTSSDQMMES